MEKKIIYTVGYTLFQKGNSIDLETMFNLLKSLGVQFLLDVRSVPFSKQYLQCNANNMKYAGKSYGVVYGHIPELGAKASETQDVFSKASDIFFDHIFPISKSNRPEKTELRADETIVDFTKFRNDEVFQDGIKRIENAYDQGFTLALMCSEKRPLDCHRYFLVSKALEKRFSDWLEVRHIVSDENGQISTISNKELDSKLKETIFNKSEIKKLDVLAPSFNGLAPIDNYHGKTIEDKIIDFCDRYWNLMHGWKRTSNVNNNNYQDYD